VKRFLGWLREFFCGRPMTKRDILRDRLRACAATGIKPENVDNFWTGIEELRPDHQRKHW